MTRFKLCMSKVESAEKPVEEPGTAEKPPSGAAAVDTKRRSRASRVAIKFASAASSTPPTATPKDTK